MIKEAIQKIVSKHDLTYEEAYCVMNEIMNGKTSPTENAAYLAALSTKSAKAETTAEIAGSAAAMREHALAVEHPGVEVLEIVGTGGDHAGSINISTTASFIIAAAGIAVAKHGNRAASSKSGAADCLEALGVNIDLAPETCTKLLKSIGLCFMFAQKYHTSMKYVGAIRKELGIRTVFNILGPLTNPARPERMILGVYDEYLLEPLTRVLIDLGVQRGMVIYGTAKNQNGRKFFLVKNSWGEAGKYKGHWYASYNFVKGKTMNIVINRKALPDDIAKKLGISNK